MWINGILFNVLFPEGRGTPMLSDVMLVGNIHRDSKVAKCQMCVQNLFLFLPLKSIHCET